MAGLNLVPNPTILAIQAGIFLTTLMVIKNFFLAPYLKVRHQRENATTGSQADAAKIQSANEAAMQDLTKKLSDAAVLTKKTTSEIRQKAQNKRDEILGKAEDEARAQINAIRTEIDKELKQEKTKLPTMVASLSDQIYQEVLN